MRAVYSNASAILEVLPISNKTFGVYLIYARSWWPIWPPRSPMVTGQCTFGKTPLTVWWRVAVSSEIYVPSTSNGYNWRTS